MKSFCFMHSFGVCYTNTLLDHSWLGILKQRLLAIILSFHTILSFILPSYSINILRFCSIVNLICWTLCFLWKFDTSFTSIIHSLLFDLCRHTEVFPDTCKQVYKMSIFERWQSLQGRTVNLNLLSYVENIQFNFTKKFSFTIVHLE